MSIIGTHGVVMALHDTNTNDIISVGFVAKLDGVLAVKLRKDSSSFIMATLAGHYYPFDIEIALSTGSTASNTPALIFGSARAG